MRLLRFALASSLTIVAFACAAQPDADVTAKLTRGVWAYVDAQGRVVVSGSFLGVPPDDTLTAAARQRRRDFDFRSDDPVLGCGPPGMPRALTAGSPMTFEWNGDDLLVRFESMDVRRVVHMSDATMAAAAPRSPNGYSTGHWEGDALVIETARLDDRVMDLQGTPKSEAMTLEERYRIDDSGDETYLRVDLLITDPETFVAPYPWHFDFVLEPDWELLEYACEERPIALTPGLVPE